MPYNVFVKHNCYEGYIASTRWANQPYGDGKKVNNIDKLVSFLQNLNQFHPSYAQPIQKLINNATLDMINQVSIERIFLEKVFPRTISVFLENVFKIVIP